MFDDVSELPAGMLDGMIREQPALIPHVFTTVADQLAGRERLSGRRLLLIGSGSSLNALATSRPEFVAGGFWTEVLNPASFLREPSLTADAAIVCSQSGRSRTSVDAVRAALQRGIRTLVLTAEADSPIAAGGELVLMSLGSEPVGPKTKGYTGTLAALLAISRWCSGSELEPGAFDDLADALQAVEAPARELAASADELDYLMVAGGDCHHGTALEGSLKVMEIAGVPGAAFTIEEMLHGRLHAPTSRSLCIAIAASAEERDELEHASDVMADLDVRLMLLNLTGVQTSHDWICLRSPRTTMVGAMAAAFAFQRFAETLAKRRGMVPHMMRFPGLSARLGTKSRSARP